MDKDLEIAYLKRELELTKELLEMWKGKRTYIPNITIQPLPYYYEPYYQPITSPYVPTCSVNTCEGLC